MNSYADRNCTVRREHCASVEAGGAATTEYTKFRSFQKVKLKKVYVSVIVVGMVVGYGFDVYHGTTSIGTIVLGTSAAQVEASSALLDRELASMDQVSVKSLADTAGKAQIVFEYEVQPDAAQS